MIQQMRCGVKVHFVSGKEMNKRLPAQKGLPESFIVIPARQLHGLVLGQVEGKERVQENRSSRRKEAHSSNKRRRFPASFGGFRHSPVSAKSRRKRDQRNGKYLKDDLP